MEMKTCVWREGRRRHLGKETYRGSREEGEGGGDKCESVATMCMGMPSYNISWKNTPVKPGITVYAAPLCRLRQEDPEFKILVLSKFQARMRYLVSFSLKNPKS